MGFQLYQELVEAAQNPPDLKSVVTPERIERYRMRGDKLQLMYGCERIDESILHQLYQYGPSALLQMIDMQSGGVVNIREDRAALHTALREGVSGWVLEDSVRDSLRSARLLVRNEIEKLRLFLDSVDSYTDIVQVGIGGSSLGPQAVYLALKAYSLPNRRAHFISNVDPDQVTEVLRRLDLEKTLFVVVSKSGSTWETLTNEAVIRTHLQQKGLCPRDHLIAVTRQGSPMDDVSLYRNSFYIWDFVGGRYSVTSMVGGVILGFAIGMERFMEFLRGAYEMDQIAKGPLEHNLPLLGSLLAIWNRNYLNLATVAMIPYSQALARFPAYLQQLDMESNGKQYTNEGKIAFYPTGRIVWGEVGTSSQHSFFQLLHQGSEVVPLEMIGFRCSQYGVDSLIDGSYSQEKLVANLFAQVVALAIGAKDVDPNKTFEGNRPSHILFAERLDPHTMGNLVSYYEHKTAFQGFIWDINSFDQQGVELGKEKAKEMVDIAVALRTGEERPCRLGTAFFQCGAE